MLALYSCTIFVGAALLFLIQPMVARLVLPQLGGSPAVWNSCLVFFQLSLLAGYLYAHGLARARNQRAATLLHALPLLAPIALFPLHLPAGHADLMTAHPAAWLLLMLSLGIAAPFVMVSTGASLLQRWFAQSDHPRAKDPYFLYAASNTGSLVGLLAYPAAIEPILSLTHQRWLWSVGYIIWAGLVMVCGLLSLRTRTPEAEEPDPPTPPPSAAMRTSWLLLALAPSSLLMGVTTYLSTDLAAVPLLWVVPLSLYLVTFIIAFSPACRALVAPACWLFLVLGAMLAALWLVGVRGGVRLPLGASFALHLSLLVTGGIACHGRLAACRPAPAPLTGFYLLLPLGRALACAFIALVAPALFSTAAEYPLAIAVVCALTFPAFAPRIRVRVGTLAGAAIAGVLLWSLVDFGKDVRVIHRERTFFGIHQVIDTSDGWRILMHGVTIHGRERLDAANQGKPTGYYHHTGPLAQVMLLKRADQRFKDIAIVGLGAGSLAAYGLNPEQHITFYEIDPAVVRIAGDKNLFTFIARCRAKAAAIIGDARLTLTREPDSCFDLIVLDAFSSDAIPVHLITCEALSLYLAKLTPDGVIALHISNRYLDLAPVLAADAQELGLAARIRRDPAPTPGSTLRAEYKSGSTVVVLSRRDEHFAALAADPSWTRLAPTPGFRTWTDDYSNILGVLDLR